MKKIKVTVLMGGKSAEHEVSLASGKEVLKHLSPQKYEAFQVLIDKQGQGWQTLVQQKPDVVFLALHGPFGEDGTIQGLLEFLGLPYTGSKVLASALGMDKILSRKIWQQAKIEVVPSFVLYENNPQHKFLKKWPYPFVVKPYAQGSSVGVSVVHKKEELGKALNSAFSYGKKVVVEKYIRGMEITCGVIGSKKPLALPLVEIIPKHEFFDYACKYTPGMSEEIVPARIDKKTTRKIQQMAVKAYKILGCQGFARIDGFFGNNDKIYLSEVNTVPGLTANSLLPKEAKAAGISFPQLLDKIINDALEENLA